MTPLRIALTCLACVAVGHGQAPPPTYDVIVRHGTVLDGSGNPRYDADIGVRNGVISRLVICPLRRPRPRLKRVGCS